MGPGRCRVCCRIWRCRARRPAATGPLQLRVAPDAECEVQLAWQECARCRGGRRFATMAVLYSMPIPTRSCSGRVVPPPASRFEVRRRAWRATPHWVASSAPSWKQSRPISISIRSSPCCRPARCATRRPIDLRLWRYGSAVARQARVTRSITVWRNRLGPADGDETQQLLAFVSRLHAWVEQMPKSWTAWVDWLGRCRRTGRRYRVVGRGRSPQARLADDLVRRLGRLGDLDALGAVPDRYAFFDAVRSVLATAQRRRSMLAGCSSAV